MKTLDQQVSYYTRKVVEHNRTHLSKRSERHDLRFNRLMNYKAEMHRQIMVELLEGGGVL